MTRVDDASNSHPSLTLHFYYYNLLETNYNNKNVLVLNLDESWMRHLRVSLWLQSSRGIQYNSRPVILVRVVHNRLSPGFNHKVSLA